ncbi:MAG: SUF system NifU family Fe-S cluster assembly protein [Gammaproteobacteria bacterium]|nr:SUF system NifU family Fe-S cluster assembly protein [Gammaproteobacteria bacterium]
MDLNDLYRDVIVDHNKSPRNFGDLTDADHSAQGFNPLCGDELTVYLNIKDDQITDVRFKGQGCAISIASASLMTEKLKGLSVEDTRQLFGKVHSMLTADAPDIPVDEMGKLAALQGVRAYPSRVKCASLCWHTVIAALDKRATPVSTE